MKSPLILVAIGLIALVFLVGVLRRTPSNPTPVEKNISKTLETSKAEIVRSKLIGFSENPTEGNNILNLLVEEGSPTLGEELSFIIFNRQCSTAWRNYCIQHLANYYIRYGEDKYFKAVLNAVDLEDRELASTAIFNAARICLERKLVESDENLAHLIKLVDDNLKSTRHAHMRIAAIRSIVVLKLKQYNALIGRIATDEQEELSLRVTAIDAIGNLGIETFERELEALRFSKVRLLSAAASTALKRLHPLTSVVPADNFSVSTLKKALTNKHAQIRNEAAIELRKYGAEAHSALPEISSALMLTDQNTTEFEVSVFLEMIRGFGLKASYASESVCSLLNERAAVLAGKDKDTLNRIRAYALITLADIGIPESAYGYIADSLENSDTTMQLNFAAGAYAVSKIRNSKRSVFFPFLLRALKPDFENNRLSLKCYNAGIDEASYTSARIEAIRALSELGPSAADALPLLESVAKATPPKNCPLTQAAAISAISRIKGAQP